MKKSQLNAISYAYSKRAKEKRRKFIIEREGNLQAFEESKYKSEFWYILHKYNTNIY